MGDGVAIGAGQGRYQPLANARIPAVSGQNDDDIDAKVLKLILDERAGALADGNHRGDGGNADDNAEDGQAGAHFITRQGPQGHANRAKSQRINLPSRKRQGLLLCVPTTTLAPAEMSPETMAVNLLSLMPVSTATARNNSPSTIHTCR